MEKIRIQQIREKLNELKLDGIFITNQYNRRYMTGFTGSAGYVLITAKEAVLFSDFRYKSQAPQQAKDFEFVELGRTSPLNTVKLKLDEFGVQNLGFEQNDVNFAFYTKLTKEFEGTALVPTDLAVETLRMIKDESELKIMQQAADIADHAFSHIVNFIKPGLSEKEIALELEYVMRKNGAASSSFDIIVASGERSALPHGIASERIVQNNEFVKLDFGAIFNGYCSDITRTVFVGTPSEKHKEIYSVVLESQLNALNNLKAGITGKEGDALSRDVIAKHGYGDLFGHGLGHSLGLEVHESPRLSPMSDEVLKPNMVLTVEPGIYVPDFGGVRIEDDVVITESGIHNLTHSTKEFIIIN
ncbi:M24 family metallopeptidase [Chengkuizengella axinellae]|uniref:Xaa-Pro peptidase family protein n=1 Tax=Chengkuizengella axinellae TaxID=3064388 RepID=A0ABT9J240_9BACL|nr:Xaa-Pro peptidase family protein [Chengkuizengella sp. 2205SS18-9]MDP5275681.1 Xaa-Pro peptidase family protein [Chengkuizengella sp. 2205SS18-9]